MVMSELHDGGSYSTVAGYYHQWSNTTFKMCNEDRFENNVVAEQD